MLALSKDRNGKLDRKTKRDREAVKGRRAPPSASRISRRVGRRAQGKKAMPFCYGLVVAVVSLLAGYFVNRPGGLNREAAFPDQPSEDNHAQRSIRHTDMRFRDLNLKPATIRQALAAMFAIIATCMAITAASALGRNGALAFPVTVEMPKGMFSFGSVREFMRRLRIAGHVCKSNEYENGINIDCADAGAPPLVYLGLVYAPTRSPEFVSVNSIRAHGINGGELPSGEWLEFLAAYSRSTAKPYP
jgi:hypothetical protein